MLGPILFLIYLLPLSHILRKHGIKFHFYADDGQIYIKTLPSPTDTVSSLNNCLKDIQAWMSISFLQLNGSKTEAILIGTKHQCATAGTLALSIDNQPITLSPAVTNLGVIFDSSLSFQAHIKNICRISYFHLRNIARLKPSLSSDDLKTLVNALIFSKIDYANALLYGLPAETIRCLKVVMHSCARMLTGTRRSARITPVLAELHWLPVEFRIKFKVLLLTYRAIHQTGPSYLSDLITVRSSALNLRSSRSIRLDPPRTNLPTMGGRAFCAAAPDLWNALPEKLRNSSSVESFKSGLKTLYYAMAFPPPI